MLSSSVPLSSLPLVAPNVGVASSAKWMKSSVGAQCKRLSSTLSTAVPKAEEPKIIFPEVTDSQVRENGEFARPLRPYRSMWNLQARSATTFFENKHGFPKSVLGVRSFHSDAQCSASNQLVPPANVRSFSNLLQQRKLTMLEDDANKNPRVARMQADYLQELVKVEPQWVVERFESGRFSVNSECAKYYLEALGKLGKLPGRAIEEQPKKKRSGFLRWRSSADKEDKDKLYVDISAKSYLKYMFAWAVIAGFGLYMFKVVTKKTERHKGIMPDENKRPVTFKDVAGVHEAKEELRQVIDFLRNPDKYKALGAKIPTGVLLVGPPGNGKTLLARAVAGEADVPFFFASGAEFEEMFVGVGASRIRSLFAEARQHSPCIVFIDELDAVGGKRTPSAHHPYARQTINQLLVELDGFEEHSGVIVIAATNTPEVLDNALTRPGRFDTTVTVELPDVRGRKEMLELHARGLKLGHDVNFGHVARATPAHTGAELKNIVNQAAIQAAVESAPAVFQRHFDFARDKTLMGSESRSKKQPVAALRNTAYHEAGHALVGLLTPGCQPLYKATIVPRGNILGLVQSLPDEEKGGNQGRDAMKAQIAMFLGGLVGEEVEFGKGMATGGAGSDLSKATRMAHTMITKYGMSDKVGRRMVDPKRLPCSQALMETVDDEVKIIVDEAYAYATELITKNQVKHKALAEALLKYETLTSEEMRDVIAGKKLRRTV